MVIHRSLESVALGDGANGPLLDTIRRIHCFALTWCRWIFAKMATAMYRCVDEPTEYLEMGSYRSWDEEKRQAFC